MAKVTAQDFQTMKKQRADSMLSSSSTTTTKQNKQTKKISPSSPTKPQVLPLPQKKLSALYFQHSATVWVNYTFSWVENKSIPILLFRPIQNEGTVNSQACPSRKPPCQASFAVWQNRAAMQACPCPPENPELSSRQDQTKPRMLHECCEVWPSSLPLGLHHWRNIVAAYVNQHYV